MQKKQGIRVLVQPSNRRVFHDEEYKDVGAEISEDISPASTVLGVKEVPPADLIPERTYMFFSHTIKAQVRNNIDWTMNEQYLRISVPIVWSQAENMPLLDKLREHRIRTIDYECIRKDGDYHKPRLVAFGRYAGIAGAIDFLRGLGERFLSLGHSTPLLNVRTTENC